MDITKVSKNNNAAWDLICEGHTKGVFQIESRLGKTWCRKIKPRNIEDLAALVSVIRPGTLKAVEDGKTMTQRFADRKAGTESITSLHESVDHIVKNSFGIIIYQEQCMQIAQVMAGFSEQDADILRKAIGKKKAKLMEEVRGMFIKGCLDRGHKEDDASRIFDIIEKSNRYSFNKSHAVSYAETAYWSAFLKANHPRLFYLQWLREAKEKPDTDLEVRELIMSAKVDDIEVFGPRMEYPEDVFSLQEKGIYFGISNIKRVGIKEGVKLRELLEEHQPKKYLDLLLKVIINLKKDCAENMIAAGVFTSSKQTRSQIAHDMACVRELSPKELEWLVENVDNKLSLEDNLSLVARTKKEGGGCHNAKRVEAVRDIIKRLNNPGRSMRDDPAVFAGKEEKLLGVGITFAKLDGCADASLANMTCRQFSDGRKSGVIACEVSSFREHDTSNGTMCFLSVEDETGELDNVVIFAGQWEEFGDIIYDKATVLLYGERSDRGSFVVEKVMQI